MKIDSTELAKQPAAVHAFRACFVAAIAALLSGCAGSHPRMTLDAVGPAPASVANSTATNGSLVVFSETETAYDSDSLASSSSEDWTPSSYTWEYSSYKILYPDGRLLGYVRNNAGSSPLHPEQIQLPAGNYRVVASSYGYGRVAVPVVVAPNQLTVLHLDGDGFWPNESGFNATNSVHLPDGRIVGWRADTEAVTTQRPSAQKI